MTSADTAATLDPAGRSLYDERYVRVMGQVWSHPFNDQRPAVLRYLSALRGRFARVLDVGVGDAYYLGHVAPQRYTCVEPNERLRETSLARARDLRLECRAFRSVGELLAAGGADEFDLALLIHVLLYLEPGEIRELFPKLAGMPLVMVYPWPPRSTTVKFENSLAMDVSLRKIGLAHKLLGRPQGRLVVRSHLYMPSMADIESLAFLVSHCALGGEYDERTMARAGEFVLRNMRHWRGPEGYKIPQSQILESYNCHLYPPPSIP
jgi:hypothetical protein